MEQPEGFEKMTKDGKPLVCKLNKAIYGLRQAGRNWNEKLDKWLRENNMIQSTADPCLYVMRTKSKDFFAIVIYVDDIITVSNNSELHSEFVKRMSAEFKIVDIGNIERILGIRVKSLNGNITLDQDKYANEIIESFNMKNANTAITPAVKRGPIQSKELDNRLEYLRLVGSLMYLNVGTRPDIAYAVGLAGQKMVKPTEEDWIDAKRILRYVKLNTNLGPQYSVNGNIELVGYTDADWANNEENRRSITGYVFILAGGPISWGSRKQQTVAISTTEAEYMSICAATQEALYLRYVLRDLGHEQIEPTTIYTDNQGAIALAEDGATNKRTKHIDIKHH
ncbi:MAG: reverse transcriptase domain-containing protein, partial [Fervidobacterium pennivorans]